MSLQSCTLPNGLRIVTEHMPALESAAIGLWVEAGARHERAAENGIAHFLEHMAFKGTQSRSALEIAQAIENVGGYINAYTGREMTAYYTRVLGGDVALALDVLGDILCDSVFAPEDIEMERGVILQEIGQVLDTPDDVIFDWLQAKAWPRQAMGRAILGTARRVQSFTRADFQGFVQRHYTPQRLILSAAGAVDHDRIVQQAERLFGSLPAGGVRKRQGARFGGGEHRVDKDLEQAHFALGFESPHYHHPDLYTAQTYALALGGGMSSRLFQEVREKRGLCYSVFAHAEAYTDTGMTTIYAGTAGAQVAELATIVIDVMKQAASDLEAEEIARARAQLKAGLLMGLESPLSRATRQARTMSIWGQVPPPAEIAARIDAVSDKDVRHFAAHMAVEAPGALALYGPVAGAPSLDALQSRRAA